MLTVLVLPGLPPPSRAADVPVPAGPTIQWERYSDDVFVRAKREHKFVLMDLEAVWCHWCHVMDEITYRDPKVIELMRGKYIAVKVDQDSRPDLANRYEDFGWPATIVFNAAGGEIVKRQGYIPPGPMARMLQAIIDDPTPGPSVVPEPKIAFGEASELAPDLRAELELKLARNYDAEFGGWGTIHKFVDWDAVEYSMNGDEKSVARARQTLTAGLHLIDSVWGGVYQYSTDGDWNHPHYEKLLAFQAHLLRLYSLAYARYHDPQYLQAAQKNRGYIANFLTSSDGAFYVSQDADVVQGEHSGEYFALPDAARRKRGIPRIDTHQYARETGWGIEGLVAYYRFAGNEADLQAALRAAQWATAHRAIEGGGFAHDERDVAGPYLDDTLAMGRAFLSLYQVTGDREWLARAQSAAAFIAGHFRAVAEDEAGFITALGHGTLRPRPQIDENVAAARFFNLLYRYTGKAQHKKLAGEAMRFLTAPQVARSRNTWGGGILLASAELSAEPVHVTIVGSKGDTLARQLFATAQRTPSGYLRVEWWDTAEGLLPNPDVQYPQLSRPAAFLCTANSCSPPIFNSAGLENRLHQLAR